MPETNTAIHHAGITVSNLERSLRFWRDGLGTQVVLDQTRQGGYFGEVVGHPDAHCRMVHLAFADASTRIELFEFLSPVLAAAGEISPPQPGFSHICVTCPDLASLLIRLEAGGGSRVSDPVPVTGGVNQGALAVYVRDPDGNVLELIQPAPVTAG